MNNQPNILNPNLNLGIVRQLIGQEFESVQVTEADFKMMAALRKKPHKCYIAAYVGKNPIILSFKADKRTAVGLATNAVRQLRQNNIRAFIHAVMPVDSEETLIINRIFDVACPTPEFKPGPAPVESQQDQQAPNRSSGILKRMSNGFYKACVGIASLI